MPEQLWLPGLEAPPKLTDGLFFAVFPDSRTAAAMAKLGDAFCTQSRSKSKPLVASRLHVTLGHLGKFSGGLPQEVVDAASNAAGSIRMEPFSVQFDMARSFASRPRPGPWVLTGSDGVAGLYKFQEALAEALRNAGIAGSTDSSAEPFLPHVTLAYGLPWAEAIAVEPACWNVREFALVHSLVGRTRHVVLAKWSLAG